MVIIMADLKGVVSLKYAENKPDSILKRKEKERGWERDKFGIINISIYFFQGTKT